MLRKDDLLKQIQPSEAELKAFYERNKATYNNSIPEKRKVRYVVLDTAKIEAGTTVSREELQAYYDQHRDDYRVPEQVSVSHILIKTPLPGPDGKVDPKGVEEARKKAEDVLKQVKAGGNFAELAKKYSEDPGSGKNGGSLGFIGRGRTVPEFEKAAFSLAKGATSDLVQSSYGFHIIRVDDKQAAHVKTLDEVKDQIEQSIKQQKAGQAVTNQVNALLAQARSAGLDKAAAAKGLQVVSTDFVSRTDNLPGIGNSPQFMSAVFGQAEKAPPDQVQLPQGYAVFEVEAIKPAATPTFDEIRSRVESEFKNERVAALLSQKTSGTFRSRQGRARPEEGCQRGWRHDQDQRTGAARRPGAGYRFHGWAGCRGLHHEAGRHQRTDQQRQHRRCAVDPGQAGTVSAGFRGQERPDPRFASPDQAAGDVWLLPDQSARPVGEVRQDQDQSGRDEKSDPRRRDRNRESKAGGSPAPPVCW